MYAVQLVSNKNAVISTERGFTRSEAYALAEDLAVEYFSDFPNRCPSMERVAVVMCSTTGTNDIYEYYVSRSEFSA